MRTNNSYFNNGTLTPTRDPYFHPRGSAKAAPAFLLQPTNGNDDDARTVTTTNHSNSNSPTNTNTATATTTQNPFVLSMIRSDDHHKGRNTDVSQRLPEDTAAFASAHRNNYHQHFFTPVFRSSPVMPRYRSREDDSFYTLQRSPAFDCDCDECWIYI